MKRIVPVVMVALLLFSVYGCATNAEEPAVLALDPDSESLPAGSAQAGERPAGERPSGERPAGGRTNGGRPNGGPTEEGRQEEGPEAAANEGGSMMVGRVESIIGNEVVLELSDSGEYTTTLLPVGMQIGTGDFSSVSAGMMLRIALNAAGEVTAASIVSR